MTAVVRSTPRPVLGLIVAAMVTSATAVQAGEWKWTVAPYVWATGVGFDVDVNDHPVIGGDASFSDLIDDVDFAAMLHVEGWTGRTGFFVDGAYMSVSDSQNTPPDPPLLPNGVAIEAGVDLGLYEAAGFYRFVGQDSGLDLFVGARVIDLEQKVDITLPPPLSGEPSASSSDTLLDGFVGARFGMPFAKRFWFAVRADVGTGETKWSASAKGGVGMYFDKIHRYGLELAYEYFEFEVENTNEPFTVTSDIRLSGPIVGFVFRF